MVMSLVRGESWEDIPGQETSEQVPSAG
jgi:hypothetical protein